MLVFEIATPGIWLDHEDRAWAFRIEGQLRLLRTIFFDANLALNLFMAATSHRPSDADRANRERDSQRRYQIRQQLERERGDLRAADRWHDLYMESEIRFKREKWAEGNLPREFEHGLPFIYAKAFLYSLDSFDKFLAVLSKEPGVPETLPALHGEFTLAFPHLRGVRNTAQHMEDRARGLGVGGRPLDLKPLANGLVNAPGGGVLVLNCLNGSRYGSTMSDGHYGEVDVSPESMHALQGILVRVLESFKWHPGHKEHLPSA